jgi:hypothetical protein
MLCPLIKDVFSNTPSIEGIGERAKSRASLVCFIELNSESALSGPFVVRGKPAVLLKQIFPCGLYCAVTYQYCMGWIDSSQSSQNSQDGTLSQPRAVINDYSLIIQR